jgi:hypothetical protein
MFVAALPWWNRIVTGFTPRMATQYAFGPQKQTDEQTVNPECLDHIRRTAGLKPAG